MSTISTRIALLSLLLALSACATSKQEEYCEDELTPPPVAAAPAVRSAPAPVAAPAVQSAPAAPQALTQRTPATQNFTAPAPAAAKAAPAPVATKAAPVANQSVAPSFASMPAQSGEPKALPVPARSNTIAAPAAKTAPAPAEAPAAAPTTNLASTTTGNDKPLMIVRFHEKKNVDFKPGLKQVISQAQQSNPNAHYTLVSYVPMSDNSRENSRQSSMALDNQAALTQEMAKLGVPASRITVRSRYTASEGTNEQETQLFAH